MNLFLILQYGLVGAFVVLLGTFLSVMVSESVAGSVSQLFGLYTKNRTLQFLGIGMGGVLLALQALMSYKRAKALEDTANAQAEAAKAQAKATEEQAKANQNTEQGQRQERLKNAIEHLGHPSDSVRLGGAYELFHLAEETKEWRQTILDIFCAHIRRTTGEAEYRKKYWSIPSEEIQSLLTLLFVQEHEVFKGLHINLQGSCLNGAYLPKARLHEAILFGARLHRSILLEAQLQGANLGRARLRGAFLGGAQFQGANFFSAQLQGAHLNQAQLQGAILFWTQLHGASLNEAQLHGAALLGAQLQGTDLARAQLQGATLVKAQFHGARSKSGDSGGTFEERMKKLVGKESDLSEAVFSGGLTREDIDSILDGLSGERAQQLRRELEPHVDQPISHQLPQNSHAITGTYTAEEAERWIAEYNAAMPEVEVSRLSPPDKGGWGVPGL